MAQTVRVGASSHKMDYVAQVWDIKNCIRGLKVTASGRAYMQPVSRVLSYVPGGEVVERPNPWFVFLLIGRYGPILYMYIYIYRYIYL